MELTDEKLEALKDYLLRLCEIMELTELEGARRVAMLLLPEDIFNKIDPLP